ncbi:hypothetical protein G6F52_014154 [Rhizopus delemar]|nr:hypothetical protein G6F52_014154 [Rhizopus delemar]
MEARGGPRAACAGQRAMGNTRCDHGNTSRGRHSSGNSSTSTASHGSRRMASTQYSQASPCMACGSAGRLGDAGAALW